MANARTKRRKDCRKRQRVALAALPLEVAREVKRNRAPREPTPMSCGPKHERPAVLPWPAEGITDTSPEYAAARKLRLLWDGATPGLSGVMGHPSCSGLAASAKGFQGDMDAEAAEAAAKAWRSYNEAMDHLTRVGGRSARDLVWGAVIEDTAPAHPAPLRACLAELSRFWGM
jgi:hypothetical protein